MRLSFPGLIFTYIFWCISCSPDTKNKTTSEEIKKDSTVVSAGKSNITDTIKSIIAEDELLITNNKFGKIENTTDLIQLKKLYGEKNVTDVTEYGPEGLDTFKATKIYVGNPKEISIRWKQNKLHKEISTAECYQENSPYYTADNLKVGTPLLKLLEVNGKSIKFYGLGWDYGGTITSLNKGRMDGSNIFFQLMDEPDISKNLLNDKEFNTDMPLVKSNLKKIIIGKITLSFDKTK